MVCGCDKRKGDIVLGQQSHDVVKPTAVRF